MAEQVAPTELRLVVKSFDYRQVVPDGTAETAVLLWGGLAFRLASLVFGYSFESEFLHLR